MADDEYGDLNNQTHLQSQANRKMERIVSSLSYRLGKLIVDSVRRPWKIVILPLSLARLLYFYALERTWRKQIPITRSSDNFSRPRDCMVLFPTNGVGMGHMSRMVALAKSIQRTKPSTEIVFFTTNSVIHHLYQHGFTCYHLPGRKKFKRMTPTSWNSICEDKLANVIALHRPSHFIFDGTYPYRGMLNAIKGRTDIHKVWVKRPGKRNIGDSPSEATSHFDRIIIPDDYLQIDESSLSRIKIDEINLVPPLISVSRQDLLPRGSLRGRLGIPRDATAALVSLGAGVINDIGDVRNYVSTNLSSMGVYSIIADSMLNPTDAIFDDPYVRLVREYPIMQYRNCFDFAVIAGGYNSVHESVFLRLPSIILPNTETGNDDQLTRALQAAETGGFIVIEKEDYELLELGLERICDDIILSNMLESMAEKDVTIDGAPYLAEELLSNPH
jgi:hypothetical protein